jgi:NADP-dependent aldehyde dehydrogenase
VLAVLPPALTGTVHTTGASDPQLSDIVRELVKRSGRIVFNGYPTGVAVSWSMHHGGQYPAATSTSTSVGSNAISRWLRTVVYQDAPLELLPTELHDELMPGLARRIDGKLQIG